MKKRIAVEIETSEDGKYCDPVCNYCYWSYSGWICKQYAEGLLIDGSKLERRPDCTRAECKAAKEVDIAEEK